MFIVKNFRRFLRMMAVLSLALSLPSSISSSTNKLANIHSSISLATSPTSQAVFLALRQILYSSIHFDCELLYLHGTKPSDTLSHYDFDTLQLNQHSSGQRTLTLYRENITYPRHNDIHKHAYHHCVVAMLFLNDFASPDILQAWLFDTLTPRYGPVIRKDEDHFIFLTPTESVAETALLSPKFGEKIKFKLALFQADSETSEIAQVNCITVDFYAGEGGGPVVKVLTTFRSFKDNENDNHYPSNFFPDMTKDFNGHRFRITVPNVKYRFEMEWRDGAFHPKRGFYKWWLDEAIRKFNFTYIMFWSSYGKATGKPLANGTWVGAAGDLLYDRADIAVIVGTTYSRHAFFGFSAVLSYEWFFFMTHTPRNTYSPNAIFWPFSPLVWSLFFINIFFMILSLKTITQWSNDPKAKSLKWTWSTMIDYVVTTFLEQDRDGPLSTSSIRMLCAFWLLFAMVTSNAYRGALVTLIAFPVDSWIPRTFEELAYSDFGVVLNNVGKVGAAYDVLSSSTNPVFMKLFEKLEMIGQPELCLMKAMKEDYGCIIWEGITVYANARNMSDRFGYVPMIQSMDIGLFIADGFTYERRAIFKHHMDRTIDAALQMGLTIKWLELDKAFIWKERSKWEEENHKSPVHYDRYEGPQKLIISQFTGLFLLSLGGLVLASGQFIYEFWKYRHETRTNKPTIRKHSSNDDDILPPCVKQMTTNNLRKAGDQNNNGSDHAKDPATRIAVLRVVVETNPQRNDTEDSKTEEKLEELVDTKN